MSVIAKTAGSIIASAGATAVTIIDLLGYDRTLLAGSAVLIVLVLAGTWLARMGALQDDPSVNDVGFSRSRRRLTFLLCIQFLLGCCVAIASQFSIIFTIVGVAIIGWTGDEALNWLAHVWRKNRKGAPNVD